MAGSSVPAVKTRPPAVTIGPPSAIEPHFSAPGIFSVPGNCPSGPCREVVHGRNQHPGFAVVRQAAPCDAPYVAGDDQGALQRRGGEDAVGAEPLNSATAPVAIFVVESPRLVCPERSPREWGRRDRERLRGRRGLAR